MSLIAAFSTATSWFLIRAIGDQRGNQGHHSRAHACQHLTPACIGRKACGWAAFQSARMMIFAVMVEASKGQGVGPMIEPAHGFDTKPPDAVTAAE
jgi:hypothetical protein